MKISKRWKKHLEISPFYTSAPKIMIICYIVPEIWHVTYVILFFILGCFLPFYRLTAQKIKISKKEKNTWRYHQFTHEYQKLWLDDVRFLRYGAYYIFWRYYIYTSVPKNHDHTPYCSWDRARDTCNCYFSFWAMFCPFAL